MTRGRAALAAAALTVVVTLPGCGAGTPPADAAPGDRGPAASDADAVLSPLRFDALSPVAPVVGSDGLRHYAYELQVLNTGTGTAQLESVQAVTGRERAPVTGQALQDLLQVYGEPGAPGALAPGQGATLFLDLAVPAAQAVPRRLEHEVRMSYDNPPEAAQPIVFTGVPVRVSRATPVVVSAPLRGDRWFVGNGCCSPVNAHRGATLAVDGTVHVAQRFAVDFVRLGPDDEVVTGDPALLSSYPAYGEPVHAAAAGTVVTVRDGQPEAVPGTLPPGQTLQTADGNYVVVDIGAGRFAFYAHLRPGSVRPAVGDRVEVGEVLGRLGNTGNTDAPHLHFHVMDGPSPLASNGLPFTFGRFSLDGVVDPAAFADPVPGTPATVVPSPADGEHGGEMPLDGDLVSLAP